MKIMTFLSDFGNQSSYVSQMKGVALSITDARIVDITHEIRPHDIYQGAFVLQTSIPHFPAGTVHVAVVDPGVGTARRGIIVTTRTQILVGPDNGLLIPAARNLGDFFVYEIKNPSLMSNNVSNTFHGRDIFTHVAANILNGIPFEQVGPIITDFIDLDFGKFDINEKSATGKVINIDRFGNIITNINGIKLKEFLDFDKRIMLFIKNKNINIPFVKSYNFVKVGEFLSTIGSSNLFEISINQDNASDKLKTKLGDEIKILFS
jgi:S-adenosylmethionine hydrolase